MSVTIRKSVADQLCVWAIEAAPQECCGLLFGHPGAIERAERAANVDASPTQGFEIDPAALIQAQRHTRAGGSTLLGYFHSHPSGDPQPSERDAASAWEESRLWLIVTRDAIRAYVVAAGGPILDRFRPVALLSTVDHIML